MSQAKMVETDPQILEVVTRRWSPYGFSDKPVEREALRALFEAARWAPSSYNEQPWRYIVATRDQPGTFGKILDSLVAGNQVWAQHAPVLALGLAAERLARNDNPNSYARHDLGLATGNLLAEATARGLAVHQMGGILPLRARKHFDIPGSFDVVTGIAIGYPGTPQGLDQGILDRDRAPRRRRPVEEFVFGGNWGETAAAIG